MREEGLEKRGKGGKARHYQPMRQSGEGRRKGAAFRACKPTPEGTSILAAEAHRKNQSFIGAVVRELVNTIESWVSTILKRRMGDAPAAGNKKKGTIGAICVTSLSEESERKKVSVLKKEPKENIGGEAKKHHAKGERRKGANQEKKESTITRSEENAKGSVRKK